MMNVAAQAPERTEETTASRLCHCIPSSSHRMSFHRYFRDKLLVLCVIVTLFIYPVHSFTTPCCYPSTSRFVTRQFSNSQVSLALCHNDESDQSREFFIRRALPADMGTASRILADAFFGDKNFFTYQYERLQTYLSLEFDFPKRYDQHDMFVACRSTDGMVVAVCDIDNRPALKERPYMCNLAVCPEWRNQGLAKALVAKCEEQVLEWDSTELHLKARQRNGAAVALYKSLGYEVQSESFDGEYMDYLVVMKKNITLAVQMTKATYTKQRKNKCLVRKNEVCRPETVI